MPVAATAWAASFPAVGLDAPAGRATAVGLLAGAGLALAGAVLLRRGARRGARRFPGLTGTLSAVLLAVVVPFGAAAAVMGAAASAISAQASPALQLTEGTSVDAAVLLRITSAPRDAGLDRFTGAQRYLLEAQAGRIVVGGKTSTVSVPLLVGGGTELSGFEPGMQVRALGELRLAEGPGREAYVLEVKARPTPVRSERSSGADPARDTGDGNAAGPGGTRARPEQLQERFLERVAEHSIAGPRATGLLPGMVLGNRSGLDPVLEEEMKDTGLTHLTAVSGSNCGYVLAAGYLLARLVRWPRPAATAAALALLAGFVVLVGPDPSVLRASVMGGIGALAMLTGRGRMALSLLCLAVVLLLAVDPWLGAEYGFILSVLATGALTVLGPRLARALSAFMPYAAAALLSVPLAAQLACAPVLVLLQPELPVFSVAANLLAAPTVPAATLAGMGALAADPLPVLPGVLLGAASAAAAWVARVAGFFAGLPAATLPWPEGVPGAFLMAAAGAGGTVSLCAVAGRRHAQRQVQGGRPPSGPGSRRRRRGLAAALGAAAAGVLLALLPGPWRAGPAAVLPADWLVAACDVGQGDALVLRSGPAAAVLVDTGPEPAPVDRCLTLLGVERLELVALTHGHADHYGGLSGALEGRHVERIIWSAADGRPPGSHGNEPRQDGPAPGGSDGGAGASEQTDQTEQTEQTGKTGPTERREARGATPPVDRQAAVAGDRGTAGQVSWQVLWPPVGHSGGEENDASLVLLARIGAGTGTSTGISVLLTGDLEEDAARSLLARERDGLAGGVDILKVAHHGARNGGTATIETVHPALALVSVGAGNTYGHPAAEILAGLERVRARVARTDLHGTVVVAPAGNGALRVLALDSG